MAPSAFFSFCILWSSCLAVVAGEEPTDDIGAQKPALPLTNTSSTSKSNIFMVFILVQFALLLQPRGSLVYIARQTWLWRINPVLCLYETALVVYYLLFPQGNSLSISIAGFKQTAVALLFVRGLPLATDVRTGEEIHSSRITDIPQHRQIADTIETVTWSRFLNPHDGWQPLGEAYPIPLDDAPLGMHSTDKRKQIMGTFAILVAIFRIHSIQDAPFITTLLGLYIINWNSIQALILLRYLMYSNGASSDLEDAAKGPKYENEQISNQAKRILYHARTFRKKRAIDHLVHLVWLWIAIKYICDLISADRGVLFEISGSKLYSGDPVSIFLYPLWAGCVTGVLLPAVREDKGFKFVDDTRWEEYGRGAGVWNLLGIFGLGAKFGRIVMLIPAAVRFLGLVAIPLCGLLFMAFMALCMAGWFILFVTTQLLEAAPWRADALNFCVVGIPIWIYLTN